MLHWSFVSPFSFHLFSVFLLRALLPIKLSIQLYFPYSCSCSLTRFVENRKVLVWQEDFRLVRSIWPLFPFKSSVSPTFSSPFKVLFFPSQLSRQPSTWQVHLVLPSQPPITSFISEVVSYFSISLPHLSRLFLWLIFRLFLFSAFQVFLSLPYAFAYFAFWSFRLVVFYPPNLSVSLLPMQLESTPTVIFSFEVLPFSFFALLKVDFVQAMLAFHFLWALFHWAFLYVSFFLYVLFGV